MAAIYKTMCMPSFVTLTYKHIQYNAVQYNTTTNFDLSDLQLN